MIVVATTLPGFVMDDPGLWSSWLQNADDIKKSHPDGVRYFAAIQLDGRGIERFNPLLERLNQLDGDWWTFTYDDGAQELTTHNRVRRINMGENMATDFAIVTGATHMLFVSGDTAPPPDVLPKLLEVAHPIVGAECPSYALDGPPVPHYPFPVHEQLATVACMLIERMVFTKIRFRDDPDADMTDDWCYQHDAQAYLGIPEYVRKDVVAAHYPEILVSLETRDIDRRIH